MQEIEFTNDLKEYELSHWRRNPSVDNDRASTMKVLFGEIELDSSLTAADVGCGPHCGIFRELTFDTMYAIDPLWDDYQEEGLAAIVENVETIAKDSQSFRLDRKADVIFSFNSLDHSGNLALSFDNMMSNLAEDGTLYFHVHMRTERQLNAGHKMLITEADIDGILKNYKVKSKVVLDRCPLDKKGYRSYIGIVERKRGLRERLENLIWGSP